MALPDDFINAITECMNPDFTFPAITDPGLPSFALANLASNLAGINYVLDFLPPDPMNLPSLPSLSIFIEAFMANVIIPGGYPEFSFGPITIPGVEGPALFDSSGMFKLIYVCITLPFQIIIGIVNSIIDLAPALPTLSGIYAIFVQLAIDVGLSGIAVANFGLCLATAIFNLLSSLIPV